MNRGRGFAATLLCTAIAAGCGLGEDKVDAGRVAGRVNSDQITVHEVDAAMARSPPLTPQLAARTRGEMVDELIDQSLARQRAIEEGLDRAPEVLRAMEAAKTEILARAYLQRIAAAQAKPTPGEVRKYYAEHPELFAQRRLYNLEEIAVARKEGIAGALREQAANPGSMQEIADWLKAREVRYTLNGGARAAEQIPLEILPKLHSMKVGEVQVIEAGDDSLVVIRVVAARGAPLDEASAAPLIRQFLTNQRSSEAIAMEMKRLKEQAKIEYVGEFAGGGRK
jgi:EpsD family peptidyl-prolyl cis-trans isomerase